MNELIDFMLVKDPTKRPTIKEVLRRPELDNHVKNFKINMNKKKIKILIEEIENLGGTHLEQKCNECKNLQVKINDYEI